MFYLIVFPIFFRIIQRLHYWIPCMCFSKTRLYQICVKFGNCLFSNSFDWTTMRFWGRVWLIVCRLIYWCLIVQTFYWRQGSYSAVIYRKWIIIQMYQYHKAVQIEKINLRMLFHRQEISIETRIQTWDLDLSPIG